MFISVSNEIYILHVPNLIQILILMQYHTSPYSVCMYYLVHHTSVVQRHNIMLVSLPIIYQHQNWNMNCQKICHFPLKISVILRILIYDFSSTLNPWHNFDRTPLVRVGLGGAGIWVAGRNVMRDVATCNAVLSLDAVWSLTIV